MDKIVLSGFADEITSSLDRQIQVLKKLGISTTWRSGVWKRRESTHTPQKKYQRSRVSWIIRGSHFFSGITHRTDPLLR
jgi:hypothetical protein